MRRVIDILISAALLVLASPLLAAVAAINWAATRRMLFRQMRIGRDLVPFVMLKFQTMVDGADAVTTVTVGGDRRVTAVGRVLRALKMDELPQLVNVLRGEMSLVGPRPLTPNEVAAIPPEMARRVYAARPGMTGIAQLAFIDEERVLAASRDPEAAYLQVVLPQKVSLELAYAQRHTWLTDLAILVLTPFAGVSVSLRRAAVAWLVPSWNKGASRHADSSIAS